MTTRSKALRRVAVDARTGLLLASAEEGPWHGIYRNERRIPNLGEFLGELDADVSHHPELSLCPVGAVDPTMPRPNAAIYGIGLNYRDHARQQGYALPDEPAVFLKHPGAVIDDGMAIMLPFDEVGRYEVETELAVVIGRRVQDADEEQARDAIAGIAVANDVSDRVLQRSGQIALGKGRTTFCPLGPSITLIEDEEIGQERIIRTWIDDVLVQQCSTAEMIHSPIDIVRFVSRYLILEPGDILLTGTPGGTPEGLARGLAIRSGETVVSEIEGVGQVRNPVRLKEKK